MLLTGPQKTSQPMDESSSVNTRKMFENSDANRTANQTDVTKQEASPDAVIDSNLVQIRASSDELNRRIEAFIARKREQVNIVNVQEFCCHRFAIYKLIRYSVEPII